MKALSALSIALLVGSACARPMTYDRAGTHQADTSSLRFAAIAAAASANNQSALSALEHETQHQLFGMYPTYHRLNARLGSLAPSNVIDFVNTYPGTVMAEKLVADYAEQAAAKGDYVNVRAVAPYIIQPDASERCAIALGYNDISDLKSLTYKDEIWQNTRLDLRRPLCSKLAVQMTHNRLLTQDDKAGQLVRLMRIQGRNLAIDAKKNHIPQMVLLSDMLGLGISQSDLESITQNPRAYLNGFVPDGAPKTNYLFIFAISQLAHIDYRAAADYANAYKTALDKATYALSMRAVAIKRNNMLTDHGQSIDALEYFRMSLGAPFNDEEAQTYARSAVFYGQWADVLAAVNLMSDTLAQEDTWQYWRARAYEATGHATKARPIYESLAQGTGYYEMLARSAIKKTLPAPRPIAPTKTMSDAAYHDANFARALHLINLKAPEADINREWNWAVRRANERGDLAAIEGAASLAHQAGYYKQAIFAIDAAKGLDHLALSHPTPYKHLYQTHSAQNGILEPWAYGITRQESRFIAHAGSHVGAQGLMQIMPDTARQLGGNPANLKDPAVNIALGTRYLSNMQGRFNTLAEASAGYNAGPGKVRHWHAPSPTPADQWIEGIAYQETRDYAKAVLANTAVYAHQGGFSGDIRDYLGTVPARQ